ncbi:MAG TPA: hypothetical protein VHB72_01810 [Candidatus Saccharimonadales bacterium]|nr:hypothetical protein [Candidatus Saccharimonadales bacterium]
MKRLFRYEVSIITFVQFVLLSFLSLASSISSIVSTCVHDSGSCVENMLPSIILFILIAVWFGFVWVLSYSVQERRSRKLTAVLIIAEIGIAGIAYFSVKHHNNNDWLSVITSIIDFVLALWVIVLAARIFMAGGGRAGSQRRRRRRPTTSS